jgi:hypothetical protein
MAAKHKRTSPAVGHALWGAEDVRYLTELWAQGLATRVIGLRMKRSKNSIIGAAHRHHLPPRESPIKPGGVKPKVRVHRSKESEMLRLAKKAEADARAARAMVVAAERRAAAAVVSAALRLERIAAENLWLAPETFTATAHIPGIGGRGCMYPLWGNTHPTHKYCGGVQRTGHVYCEKHFTLCTHRVAAGSYGNRYARGDF